MDEEEGTAAAEVGAKKTGERKDLRKGHREHRIRREEGFLHFVRNDGGALG